MTTATKPGELRILQSSCEQKPNTAPLTPIPGSAVAASFFKLGNLKQDDASIDPLAKSIESNEKLLNSHQSVDSVPTRQPGLSIAMRPKSDSSQLKHHNIVPSVAVDREGEKEKAPRKVLENGSVSLATRKELRNNAAYHRKELLHASSNYSGGSRTIEAFEPSRKKEGAQLNKKTVAAGGEARPRVASPDGGKSGNQTMDEKLALDETLYEPMKLIDSYFKWAEPDLKLPSEQTDYVVIGVLGKQGVGKSSLISALANYGNCWPSKYKGGNSGSLHKIGSSATGCRDSSSATGPDERSAAKRGGVLSHPSMFMKTRARDSMRYDTVGVDVRVTNDRMILLDTQPVLSSAVLDWFNKTDRMPPPDIKYAENWVEMQSVQLASFLLTVCHVVIVLSDSSSCLDAELAQLVLLADMLKPAPPLPTDRNGHTIAAEPHLPNLVFVANKSQEGFAQEGFVQSVEMLKETFKSSKICLKGNVDEHSLKMELNLQPKLPAAKRKVVSSSASSSSKKKVNLCHLPVKKGAPIASSAAAAGSKCPPAQMFTGNPDFSESVRWLKNRIMTLPRTPITVHNTERQWLMHCQKMWDMTRKCQLITEYCQLLT